MKHILLIGFLICQAVILGIGQNETTVIRFESANPFSLREAMEEWQQLQPQEVFGQLTIPDSQSDSLNTQQKYPLIIGVAGSLGWREHHYEYLDMYQKMGFATFELNSFRSRGITSTVGSQNQVTIAAMVLDAYRALERLSHHPRIDPNRIGITGWSLGGGVTLFAGWKPLKEALSPDYSFAAHLAFYPPCFFEIENLQLTQAPIHILIGGADNWTPAEPCQNLVKAAKQNHQVGITIYPEAHHGFDSEEPVRRNEDGYSFKDCLFELTEEGDVMMNYLPIAMSNPLLQKLGFLFCVERGVDIGGHPEARKNSFRFAAEFMTQHLKP